MIRQLLTRRLRHVPCTSLPIKVCYSQTPTPKAKKLSWNNTVGVVSQFNLPNRAYMCVRKLISISVQTKVPNLCTNMSKRKTWIPR
jgi:hypothetical protein